MPYQVTHPFTHQTKDYHVATRGLEGEEHAGTHVDAPNHFAKGRTGVSEIPLTRLIGPAVKVDVRAAVKGHPDYLISVEDFTKWEAEHGRMAPNTIVLLTTGYGKFWPDFEKYAGAKKTADSKTVPDMHFPGLSAEAAKWLVMERQIKAVGIDTFSIDRGQSKAFESHQYLTAHDVPVFENVADMSALPENQFTVYALPMNIKDGTGAPLRIIAVLN
jgi:kynurenine formamidase